MPRNHSTPDHARDTCVDGPLECVVLALQCADVETWASGPSARKIMFMAASWAHCQADATGEMAIELPPEEHAKGEDLIGELLKSLYGTRKAAQNWEKKWQKVLIDNNFEICTWSPAIVRCRERELCGFVRGDGFIFTGESTQLAQMNLDGANVK